MRIKFFVRGMTKQETLARQTPNAPPVPPKKEPPAEGSVEATVEASVDEPPVQTPVEEEEVVAPPPEADVELVAP